MHIAVMKLAGVALTLVDWSAGCRLEAKQCGLVRHELAEQLALERQDRVAVGRLSLGRSASETAILTDSINRIKAWGQTHGQPQGQELLRAYACSRRIPGTPRCGGRTA